MCQCCAAGKMKMYSEEGGEYQPDMFAGIDPAYCCISCIEIFICSGLCQCLIHYPLRKQLAVKLAGDGNAIEDDCPKPDCCLTWCCSPCAYCQELRAMRGYESANGGGAKQSA